MKDREEVYRWSITANIRREMPSGPNGEGLKQFKGGAKVHIVGAFYGTAESIVVVGPQRNTGKMTSCVVKANTVENLRVKTIHSPKVVEFLSDFKPNGACMITSREIADELLVKIPTWASRQ